MITFLDVQFPSMTNDSNRLTNVTLDVVQARAIELILHRV